MGGIWIRSYQKNQLCFCDGFSVEHWPTYSANGQYVVRGVVGGNHMTVLGAYKTKKRCLEVLDEIQAVIVDYINTISYNITQASNGQFDRIYPIYVMPAE